MGIGARAAALIGAVWIAAQAGTAVGEPQPAPGGVADASTHLPAGTVVEIMIAERLSSKTAQPGDGFDITLAEPIVIDGRVVVPAGLKGRGAVIDAHHARMGGRPGSLTVAARFIDDRGVRLPLKSLHVQMSGADVQSAAFVAVMAVGLPGFFIQGGENVLPAGARASAKLADDVDLSSLPAVEDSSGSAPLGTPQ